MPEGELPPAASHAHAHMVAPYTVWYNFVRIHKTLRLTPAMAAGITDRLWSMEDIAALIDEAAEKAMAAKRAALPASPHSN